MRCWLTGLRQDTDDGPLINNSIFMAQQSSGRWRSAGARMSTAAEDGALRPCAPATARMAGAAGKTHGAHLAQRQGSGARRSDATKMCSTANADAVTEGIMAV
jgi:hypothetical protein